MNPRPYNPFFSIWLVWLARFYATALGLKYKGTLAVLAQGLTLGQLDESEAALHTQCTYAAAAAASALLESLRPKLYILPVE